MEGTDNQESGQVAESAPDPAPEQTTSNEEKVVETFTTESGEQPTEVATDDVEDGVVEESVETETVTEETSTDEV